MGEAGGQSRVCPLQLFPCVWIRGRKKPLNHVNPSKGELLAVSHWHRERFPMPRGAVTARACGAGSAGSALSLNPSVHEEKEALVTFSSELLPGLRKHKDFPKC